MTFDSFDDLFASAALWLVVSVHFVILSELVCCEHCVYAYLKEVDESMCTNSTQKELKADKIYREDRVGSKFSVGVANWEI